MHQNQTLEELHVRQRSTLLKHHLFYNVVFRFSKHTSSQVNHSQALARSCFIFSLQLFGTRLH